MGPGGISVLGKGWGRARRSGWKLHNGIDPIHVELRLSGVHILDRFAFD